MVESTPLHDNGELTEGSLKQTYNNSDVTWNIQSTDDHNEHREDKVLLESHSSSFMDITPEEEEEEKDVESNQNQSLNEKIKEQNHSTGDKHNDCIQRQQPNDDNATIPTTPINKNNHTSGGVDERNFDFVVDHEHLPDVSNISTISDISDFSNDSTLVYSTSNFNYNDCDTSSTLDTVSTNTAVTSNNDKKINNNTRTHDKANNVDKSDFSNSVATLPDNGSNNEIGTSTYSTFSTYSTYPFDSDSNTDTTLSNNDNKDYNCDNDKAKDILGSDYNADTTLSNNDSNNHSDNHHSGNLEAATSTHDSEFNADTNNDSNNSDTETISKNDNKNSKSHYTSCTVDRDFSGKWEVKPCSVRLDDLNNLKLKQLSCVDSDRRDHSKEIPNHYTRESPLKSPYFTNAKVSRIRKRSTKASSTEQKAHTDHKRIDVSCCGSDNLQTHLLLANFLVSDDCDDNAADGEINTSNRHYRKLRKRNNRLRSDNKQNFNFTATKYDLSDKVITVTDLKYIKTILSDEKHEINAMNDAIDPSTMDNPIRVIDSTDLVSHRIPLASPCDELKMNRAELCNDRADINLSDNDCHKVITVTDIETHIAPTISSDDTKLAEKSQPSSKKSDSCRLIKMFEIVIEPLDIDKTLKELAERELQAATVESLAVEVTSNVDIEPSETLNCKRQKSIVDDIDSKDENASSVDGEAEVNNEEGSSYYLTFADRVKLRRRRKDQLNALKKKKEEDKESKSNNKHRPSKSFNKSEKRTRPTISNDKNDHNDLLVLDTVASITTASIMKKTDTEDKKLTYCQQLQKDSVVNKQFKYAKEDNVNVDDESSIFCTNTPSTKKRVQFLLNSKVSRDPSDSNDDIPAVTPSTTPTSAPTSAPSTTTTTLTSSGFKTPATTTASITIPSSTTPTTSAMVTDEDDQDSYHEQSSITSSLSVTDDGTQQLVDNDDAFYDKERDEFKVNCAVYIVFFL